MNEGHTKIFVATHSIDALPSCYINKMYESIQCGTGIKGHSRLNTVWHDDIFPSISAHNIQLNEMTGIWWIWKHLPDVAQNTKFIGIAHYRRHLDIPHDHQFING